MLARSLDRSAYVQTGHCMYTRLHDLLHPLAVPLSALLEGRQGLCAWADAVAVLGAGEDEFAQQIS